MPACPATSGSQRSNRGSPGTGYRAGGAGLGFLGFFSSLRWRSRLPMVVSSWFFLK